MITIKLCHCAHLLIKGPKLKEACNQQTVCKAVQYRINDLNLIDLIMCVITLFGFVLLQEVASNLELSVRCNVILIV